MRILCGCVVSFSVLLSSFLGSAAWSQSGTSEPPGLDEIIAAANSYVPVSYTHLDVYKRQVMYRLHRHGLRPRLRREPGRSLTREEIGMYWILKQVYYQMPRRVKRFLLVLMIVSILVIFLLQYSTSLQAFARNILQRII